MSDPLDHNYWDDWENAVVIKKVAVSTPFLKQPVTDDHAQTLMLCLGLAKDGYYYAGNKPTGHDAECIKHIKKNLDKLGIVLDEITIDRILTKANDIYQRPGPYPNAWP
jgi:hypothetical protein